MLPVTIVLGRSSWKLKSRPLDCFAARFAESLQGPQHRLGIHHKAEFSLAR